MLATVTTKGQVTIPKDVRDRLDIKPNDRVDFLIEGGRAILIPIKTLKDLRGAVRRRSRSYMAQERRNARQAVAARVAEEME
jgi:AbrB family looped-hinge helix DNA binding protein